MLCLPLKVIFYDNFHRLGIENIIWLIVIMDYFMLNWNWNLGKINSNVAKLIPMCHLYWKFFSGCRNDRHWISVLGRLLLPLRGGCTQPHPLHLPTWNALPKWQWNLQGLWHCFIILFSIKVNDCLLLFSLTIYLLHQQECSSGTYTNHTGASTCDTCPDGFYCLPVQPDNATLNAQPCPEGYYCPAGTVSHQWSHNDSLW